MICARALFRHPPSGESLNRRCLTIFIKDVGELSSPKSDNFRYFLGILLVFIKKIKETAATAASG
jgi:hypothetical protein